MPFAITKFREAALTSELVTEAQIQAAVGQLILARGGDPIIMEQLTDRQVATQLVEMNLLSSYQADQLLTGRTKFNLGPYTITGWIGQGGMGQVFKAVHRLLGRESAIKVLPLHKATPEAIESFRREVRAQAKLDHPNLVRAFDAGVDGNVHYLVVEYVPGTDLRRLIRSKGKLSVQQAANIVKQSAEALSHAHERGLIHRDIKPGNILVTPQGTAKLSDLGLAFYLNDTTDPRLGKIVGTADYLSPEQIKTPENITHASDIYSLGCTLYYAVTGKVPFPGGTPKSKAKRHLEETPWHPRRFNEEVSDDFVDLIGDMMEKEPANRIASAEEVAERLSPWAHENSPLLSEDLDDRQRWIPAPLPGTVVDDTDANADEITEMAMSEVVDESQPTFPPPAAGGERSGTGSAGLSGSVGFPDRKLPLFESVGSVNWIKQQMSFSFQSVFLTAVICFAVGILAGFMGGYVMGRSAIPVREPVRLKSSQMAPADVEVEEPVTSFTTKNDSDFHHRLDLSYNKSEASAHFHF